MSSTRFTPNSSADVPEEPQSPEVAPGHRDGYQWTALSVTTVGALLASIQGSALLIALPNILGELHATFLTITWVTTQWGQKCLLTWGGVHVPQSAACDLFP